MPSIIHSSSTLDNRQLRNSFSQRLQLWAQKIILWHDSISVWMFWQIIISSPINFSLLTVFYRLSMQVSSQWAGLIKRNFFPIIFNSLWRNLPFSTHTCSVETFSSISYVQTSNPLEVSSFSEGMYISAVSTKINPAYLPEQMTSSFSSLAFTIILIVLGASWLMQFMGRRKGLLLNLVLMINFPTYLPTMSSFWTPYLRVRIPLHQCSS